MTAASSAVTGEIKAEEKKSEAGEGMSHSQEGRAGTGKPMDLLRKANMTRK